MESNIVAIVGRPNIGKSTLFNRLTKSKKAIVANEYGVTRDRNYGVVDWAGKEFTLIDTGGFVPETKEFFESMIRSQINIAIDEADVILYMVDSKTGISSIDSDIAKILKKSRKKIIVAVNKIDEQRDEPYVSEFYNLGLGEPLGISAMNGRNIGDMLDLITSEMPLKLDAGDEIDSRLKIAIVGKPNVGKSSLVNTFLGREKMIVSDIPGTTRDSVDSVLKYKGMELLLIDTAGLRKRKKVKENLEFYSLIRTLRAIEKSDVVILMTDVAEGLTKQDIDILLEAKNQYKGIIIAVNKWDTVKEKETNTAKEYENMIKNSLIWIPYVDIKFISVIEKKRLFKLLDVAIEIRERKKLRVPTSELNKYIHDIVRNFNPPSVKGRFVTIKYVSQVDSDPPVFSFFVNEPELLKDNYKRFLEKKVREKYGFSGVPIVFKYVKK